MKRIKSIRQEYFKKALFEDWVKEGDSLRYYDDQGRMVRIERTVPYASITTFMYDQLNRLEKSEEIIDSRDTANLTEYNYEESKVIECYIINNVVSRVVERSDIDLDKKEIKFFRNNKLVEKRIEEYANGQIIKVAYERYDDFHCKENWSNYQYDKLGYKKEYTTEDLSNKTTLRHHYDRNFDEYNNWIEEVYLIDKIPQLKFLRTIKYYD